VAGGGQVPLGVRRSRASCPEQSGGHHVQGCGEQDTAASLMPSGGARGARKGDTSSIGFWLSGKSKRKSRRLPSPAGFPVTRARPNRSNLPHQSSSGDSDPKPRLHGLMRLRRGRCAVSGGRPPRRDAAFIPVVPDTSRGISGMFSQTFDLVHTKLKAVAGTRSTGTT
jgi:hypothetical protein